MEGHERDASIDAAGGMAGSRAPRPAGGGSLPPKPPPPPRRAGTPQLNSYVSEPPSALAMMKTYAQELLQKESADKLQREASICGDIPAAGAGPALNGSAGGLSDIELPALKLDKGPLDRPPHFQLGATIGTPRAAATPVEAPTPHRSRAGLRSSIGWVTSNASPSAASEVVLEHRVAGDLIMPAATVQAAMVANGSLAPREPRRRPLLRTKSLAPAGGPSSLSGTAKPGDAAASPMKARPPPSESDHGRGDDMESLDYEGQYKPWYRKKKFWLITGPLLITLAFILAGVLYLVYGNDARVGQFQLWRICFFIAGLPLIWWAGRLFMDGVVWGVERTMFTWQNALYYCYAVRRPMANVIRAALTTGWWALMMKAGAGDMNSTLATWYNNVLKVLGCLTLFMTANLLKVLFAKMMASKFNQHSHYEKMHQSLKREYLLHLMLQPRQRYSEFEDLDEGSEELEGGFKGEDEDEGRLLTSRSEPLPLHRPDKYRTLGRLLRRSSHAVLMHKSSPETKKSGSKRFKGLFWRGSQKDLHAIEEGEEEAGGGGQASQAALPPDAVALDMDGGNTLPAGRQALPREQPADIPPAVRVRVAGPGTATPSSIPASPAKQQASPSKQPAGSPLTKLQRMRSEAMEAARLEAAALPTPHPSVHGGTAAAAAMRRLSGESEARRDGVSRDASLAGAKAASRALRPPPQRTASMASMSQRSAQPAQPPPPKPLLHHSSSLSTSSTHRQLMALRMSKMEKYIRKHALEVTFKDVLSRTERSEQVTSELEAKKLGFYLYHNVKADYDREYIVLEDLEQFLSEKDAKSGMDMLDADGNGRVNVQECCAAIARVFLDRKNLAASLKDAKSIVRTLEAVIGVFLHVLFFFIYLLIWDVDVLKAWAGFASLFLGFSFVFGNSIRTTYENVVFLFVVHPYDVGEAIVLDGDQHQVEEIHLSFTVLANPWGQRVWYPNEKLRIVPFMNISHSGARGEVLKVLVDMSTPLSVLDEVRAAIERVHREHPKEFTSACAVNLSAAVEPMKMTLVAWWEYSHSGADVGRMGRARTKIYAAVSETLMRLGVRYTWPATQDASGAAPTPAAVGAATNIAVMGLGVDKKQQ